MQCGLNSFLQPYEAGWKEIFNFYLKKIGGSMLFDCNYLDIFKGSITLPPYHQVLVECGSI